MKYLFTLCLLLGLYTASAQTDLIRHKSHSGTNQNFKVKQGAGNFGLMVIHGELEKDPTSSYKLIFTQEGNHFSYILFKTKNKALNNTMCMNDDEVLANISLSIITPDIRSKVEKLLIEELMALRKGEK